MFASANLRSNVPRMQLLFRPRSVLVLVALLALAAGILSARADDKTPPPPATPLTIRYYGHAFIYLISSTGVRIAIDPYGEDLVTYKFPAQLPADVVLISNEADDHAAGSRLFGSPQIFASVTAIGLNNARGLLFKGVQTYRDKNADQGAEHGTNATFVFKLDGIRLCHLGGIGHVPDSNQRVDIGTVDVLFLPVGNPDLSQAELDKTVHDLNPKIIVPILYKTPFSGDMNLRPLDDYLKENKKSPSPMPVQDLKASEFTLTPDQLPATPTIDLLTPLQ